MQRRDALKLGLAGAAAASLGLRAFGTESDADCAPGALLTLAPIEIELAPRVKVRTIAFAGVVPGPQFPRRPEGSSLELHNDSDSATVVCSTAFAEPMISLPPHRRARALLRRPSDNSQGANLKPYYAYCNASGATASGFVEAGREADPGTISFDQWQVLSIHRWQPRPFTRAAPFDDTALGYDYASFNDKLLSASEPIRVRHRDRVRFTLSNCSTTQGVTLGLPQHRFLVIALDGHPVPTPRYVGRLYIGPSESIDAIVTMDRPGRWILGATHRQDRVAGLGRLVEYAGASGTPVENEYGVADWNYTSFGTLEAAPLRPAHRIAPLWLQPDRPLLSSDPKLYDPAPRISAAPIKTSAGRRYRLASTNFTRDAQSLQLLNHEVELVGVAGQRTAGVLKDIVTLPAFTRIDLEFVAQTDNVFLAHSRKVSVEEYRSAVS